MAPNRRFTSKTTATLDNQVMTKADIDTLDALQACENDGRGISCVRAIVSYLRSGNVESAKVVRTLEGDKTRSYAFVEAALTKMLGCRLHSKHGCDYCLCKA